MMNIQPAKEIRQRISKNCLVKAFTLNFVALVALLLFFYPVIKSDDYYMSEICYGAMSGVYDVHLVYNNILLGYVIKGLLLLFPNVAWYVVLQIICVFCAFVSLTYFLMAWNSDKFGARISFILLIFFGYECYTKITFTKTAMVLLSIGMFLMIKSISEEKKRVLCCLLGFVLSFLGILWRKAAVESVVGLLAGICAIEIGRCLLKKKIGIEVWKKICLYIGTIIIIMGIGGFAGKLNSYLYSADSEWSEYYYKNSLKSIIDYTSSNYDLYSDEYEAIGVSENDLDMIYQNNMYDPAIMTDEKYAEVVEIARSDVAADSLESEMFDLSNILEFVQTVPINYLTRFCFGSFLVLTLIFALYGPIYKWAYWIYIIIMVFGENYYLFLAGRVLQPHIDVGIIFSACLFLIYFTEEKNNGRCRTVIKEGVLYGTTVGMLVLYVITNFFDTIAADFFLDYGSENACNPKSGKEIMDVITEDKGHLYITPSKETVFSRWAFNTFEVMPKEYYSNMFSLGANIWASHRSVLDNYNVENPLKEMVDSEKIYFLTSDDFEEEYMSVFLTYIREHYEENAFMVKIKEVDTVNIYRCFSGEINIKQLPEGNKCISYDVAYSISDNGLWVEGYCFEEDSNSYCQDIYVEIVDAKTKEENYYTTLKTENYDYIDIMNGKYSRIQAGIEAGNWDAGDEINIVLVSENGIYRIPIAEREG